MKYLKSAAVVTLVLVIGVLSAQARIGIQVTSAKLLDAGKGGPTEKIFSVTVQNPGDEPGKVEIRGLDTAHWTLAAQPGENQFAMQFSNDGGTNWTSIPHTKITLIASLDGGMTHTFQLKFKSPITVVPFDFTEIQEMPIKVSINHIPPIYWAKTFGGNLDERAFSVLYTNDNKCVVAGYTMSFGGAQDDDAWIIKLELDGTLIWEKAYGGGGTEGERFHSIRETVDGGYIALGYTMSFGPDLDIWLLKLNLDGTIAWQKTYGDTNYNYGKCIQQTNDGGYIVLGDSGSDTIVLKLNSGGNIVWQKNYGDLDYKETIQQTNDGGYILVGSKNFGIGQDYDFWAIKLDPDGNIIWKKNYNDTTSQYVGMASHSIAKTSDGGFILAGETKSIGVSTNDVWILKLNQDGSIGWQKAYGGTNWDAATNIYTTSDNGYIVAGQTRSFGAGGYDFWVLKLNQSGSIGWQKAYGGSNEDRAFGLQPTGSTGYIVTGWTKSYGIKERDIWVLKLHSDGSCPPLGQDTSATITATNATAQDMVISVTDSNLVSNDTNTVPFANNPTIQQQAP